jgi:hypothetical protein
MLHRAVFAGVVRHDPQQQLYGRLLQIVCVALGDMPAGLSCQPSAGHPCMTDPCRMSPAVQMTARSWRVLARVSASVRWRSSLVTLAQPMSWLWTTLR